MMYVDGDNNLEENALEDINEMEMAEFPSTVKVIVLVDRTPGESSADGNWTGTRLYEIKHDTTRHYQFKRLSGYSRHHHNFRRGIEHG
jgi:hypothetical protein